MADLESHSLQSFEALLLLAHSAQGDSTRHALLQRGLALLGAAVCTGQPEALLRASMRIVD